MGDLWVGGYNCVMAKLSFRYSYTSHHKILCRKKLWHLKNVINYAPELTPEVDNSISKPF